MKTFSVGDRVRYEYYNRPNHRWNGMIGTVTGFRGGNVTVSWDKGSRLLDEYPDEDFFCHVPCNLTLLNFELKYDPTQQGDKEEDI